MARIALIGASGNVGTRILNELVSRNHQVTAIVRDPTKVPARAGVTAARGDVADPAGLAEALKGHDAVVSSVRFLDALRGVTDLDWTFISPSALFVPGERTGKFRLAKDELLVGEKGSTISYEDYAVALVDEIEKPAHVRERFTVGY